MNNEKTLTKFVIFSIAAMIIYSAVEFVVSSLTGMTHDQLTICFFSFFGGEIVSCACIKIFKLHNEKKIQNDTPTETVEDGIPTIHMPD